MLEQMTGVWKEVDEFVKDRYIPIHMMVEVSRKCNINCNHCYNIKDKAHLTIENIDHIFAQLRQAGTLFITLTGGEFFAHPQYKEILYLARDYGFDIRMITNGTLLTEKKAKILKDVNMSEVGVSVLGAFEETHDAIARVPGSYQRCIQGIKNCVALGVPVHIKTTLMQENFHEYPEIIKLAERLGVVYMIDPVVTPRDDGDTKNLKHRIDDRLMEEFYMQHFNEMDGDAPVTEYQKGLPCDAGTGFGAISADGSIYPCIQLPKKIGNIFEDNFQKAWDESPLLNYLRNVPSHKVGHCDSCGGGCSHCPGLAFLETGDPLGTTSTGCFVSKTFKKHQAQCANGTTSSASHAGCGCH